MRSIMFVDNLRVKVRKLWEAVFGDEVKMDEPVKKIEGLPSVDEEDVGKTVVVNENGKWEVGEAGADMLLIYGSKEDEHLKSNKTWGEALEWLKAGKPYNICFYEMNPDRCYKACMVNIYTEGVGQIKIGCFYYDEYLNEYYFAPFYIDSNFGLWSIS